MESTQYGLTMESAVENGQLTIHLDSTDTNNKLGRYYIEIWSSNGALVDGCKVQRHLLAEEEYVAEPVQLSLEEQSYERRPSVKIVLFDDKESTKKIIQHEFRFFSECQSWHFVETN